MSSRFRYRQAPGRSSDEDRRISRALIFGDDEAENNVTNVVGGGYQVIFPTMKATAITGGPGNYPPAGNTITDTFVATLSEKTLFRLTIIDALFLLQGTGSSKRANFYFRIPAVAKRYALAPEDATGITGPAYGPTVSTWLGLSSSSSSGNYYRVGNRSYESNMRRIEDGANHIWDDTGTSTPAGGSVPTGEQTMELGFWGPVNDYMQYRGDLKQGYCMIEIFTPD